MAAPLGIVPGLGHVDAGGLDQGPRQGWEVALDTGLHAGQVVELT